MTTAGEPSERPFVPDLEPFAGFELGVLVDRPAYTLGDTVRISVTATNSGDRWAVHEYPGWQRVAVTVRDEHHRVVATDAVTRDADGPVRDRWLPGQMAIFPLYWHQTEGPIVPAWSSEPPGARVAPGRYRVRATWLGREPGSPFELPDAWSSWFEIV